MARELSDGVLTIIKGPGFGPLLVAAAVVTATLAIPSYGIFCAAALMTLGSCAYGETIRRVSPRLARRDPVGLVPGLLPSSPARLLLGLVLALGTVLPLWWFHIDVHQSPHWDNKGRAIAAATWLVVPC